MKVAVLRYLPSNLTEIEGISLDEWDEQPKSRCAKLIETFLITFISVSVGYYKM